MAKTTPHQRSIGVADLLDPAEIREQIADQEQMIRAALGEQYQLSARGSRAGKKRALGRTAARFNNIQLAKRRSANE